MKASSTSSSKIDDILSKMSDIGLGSNRIKQYKKNIVFSFSDGYMVAELISIICPSYIDIKSFFDEGSEVARSANWNRLCKVLQRIGLKLTKDEVNAIITRLIDKELVTNFIHLLIDKLNEIKKGLPEVVNKNENADLPNDNKSSTSTIGNTKSTVLKRTSVISTTNTLSTKTQHILGELERKKEVSRRVSLMSSKELDDIYSHTVKIAREESQKLSAIIDEMQKKSETIDSEFRNLKTKNEEELVKTTKRLSVLELEVKAIENDNNYMITLDEEDTSNISNSFSVFGFERVQENQPTEVTYTRVFSVDDNAYYYVNNSTQNVQWEQPLVDEQYIIDFK